MNLKKRTIAFQVAALLAAPLSVALGQAPVGTAEGVRVFEPAYFMEFDPLNAYDMVSEIPGVSVQETDGGRGLSGVRSNLLINGERPPPKGMSAQDRLRQMPITAVQSIELIDSGARLDLDMQGYPQVINVIVDAQVSTYYEFITQVQHGGTGARNEENESSTSMEGTAKFTLGRHEISVSGNSWNQDGDSPLSLVSIDPANPVQRYSSIRESDRGSNNLKLDAILALGETGVLTINGEIDDGNQTSQPLHQDSIDGFDVIDQGSDRTEDRQDFSAEYRRPIATGGELMVAFVDTTSTNYSESFYQDAVSSRTSISESETGETAARILLTNSPTERITIRTNVNNARNTLDGGFRIVGLFGSTSQVEESRQALDSSVDWVITDKWNFRSTLGVEQYEITSVDATSGVQTDPKGEIAIVYRPQRRTTVTLSTNRSVGQLNFNQFLASADLDSEILSAGASALEPERQRTHSISYDRRFADRGVMQFSLSRSITENPVNTVALSDLRTITQNTSPSTVDTLAASVQFPLDRFGLEDMVLSVGARFTDSEIIDPITGELREVASGGNNNYNRGGGGGGNNNFNRGGFFFGNFGGFVPKYLKQIELRKDPGDGKWSWSISARDVRPNGSYSTRDVRFSSGEKRWNASVTFEPRSGLRFSADIEGPRDQIRLTSYYPGVRQVALDPWYLSEAITKRGSQISLSAEWRGPRFEVRGSLTSRSDVDVFETLTPFGLLTGTQAYSDVARSPMASLRFRVKN